MNGQNNVKAKPSQEKVWLKYLPEECRNAVIPEQTIYDYIKEVCQSRPKGKAIYYYGTSVTYGEMLKKIDQAAEAYYALGVREGDYVSFLTVTLPEAIYSMYGLNKIGAVGNFIDPRMDVQRILDAIEGVKSKVLVTIDLAWPKVAWLRNKLKQDYIVSISANDSLSLIAKAYRALTTKDKPQVPYDGKTVLRWKDLMARGKGGAKQVPFKKDSVATITYTGGTTGTPKGVMLTNDGMNCMAQSFAFSGVDYQHGERFLEIMPIFASYGVGCGIHMPFAMRQENVIIPKFTPDELGALIKKYRPNHMMGVPSFYERIMHSKDLWDMDLSFLKTTGCGGDTMNPGLEERFNKFMKEKGGLYNLSQGYGLSEMTGAATCCYSHVYKDDSSGIPLFCNSVGIFDPETGEELDYGEEGEVCLTGRGMMLGYHNNPEETDKIIRTHADGTKWIHSGDIGYMDEDGFLYIRGRIKQIIIKFDGHKVFPVQIEGIINRHKAVAACTVVGIQDPDHAQGSVPLGVVELKKDIPAEQKETIRKEILQMCDELLEERGKPSDVTFIDEMLHTALAKHDYRALTEMFKDHVIRK
jgi:long-chain acyl-CoA synthetase